ncbi:UNVERIFIED_CONTAM: hypothetical protein FKN15_049344 [Acipenser sinensis]
MSSGKLAQVHSETITKHVIREARTVTSQPWPDAATFTPRQHFGLSGLVVHSLGSLETEKSRLATQTQKHNVSRAAAESCAGRAVSDPTPSEDKETKQEG